MGSFYSTCSVSNMTLVNQKTSIQLLISNRENLNKHKSMIVFNEGSQGFYSPFAFTINGFYDDYGYLENIVEDHNTKMLEDFFNMSIYDIIEKIGSLESDKDVDVKNIDIFKSLSMTYFRTEVLEYLQKGWQDLDLDNPDEYTGEKELKDFFDYYFRDNSNDKSRMEHLSSLKSFTEDERNEFISLIRSESFKPRNYIATANSKNMFNILPINIDFKKDILKQFKFIESLNHLKKILLPSLYGGQDSNYLHIYNLNEFVNDLLIDDIRTGYYYDDDKREAESILNRHQRNINLRKLGI